MTALFNDLGKIPYEIKVSKFEYELDQISEGRNLFKDHIIFKEEDLFRVFNRVCDHNGGRLCDKGGHLVCPMHGWEFEPETGSYTNVQHTKKEEDFVVEGNKLVIRSESMIPRIMQNDCSQDLRVQFLTHATLLFESKDFSFATDPWIEGFAFSSGWWVSNHPPENWVEKLNSVDFIYISHNHPDHLNHFTLEKVRKDMLFVIPGFDSQSVEKILRRLGFNNLHICEFNNQYRYKDSDLFFSILKSGDFRDDSGFYFTYGDFSMLSTVDSNDLNFSRFPKDLTLFASSFAGGASGYPLCFDTLTEEEKTKIIKRNRSAIKATVKKNLELTNAAYFLPYAGFFKEKAARDKYISEHNIKNSVEDYEKICKSQTLNINQSDDFHFKGKHLTEQRSIPRLTNVEDIEAFYEKEFANISLSEKELTDFFEGSDFQDNLVVYFELTNDDFLKTNRKFVVDFREKNTVVKHESFQWTDLKSSFTEDYTYRLLRLKVREDSFNWTIKNNIPFEDLSIGFQCKIDRLPDSYNVAFWDHFTNIYL